MTTPLQEAIAFHRQSRLEEAEALYRQVLEQAPDQPVALHHLGLIAAERGRYEEALRLVNRALLSRPDHAAALRDRGNLLRVLDRPEEALASFDRALPLKPNDPELHFQCGNLLQALNRPEEALASYDRLLAIQPRHADALNNRGAVLRELHRPQEALASYDRALAIKPDYPEVLSNRGAVLDELSRLEEAVESYDRALALKPDYASALYNRGNALKALNRLDEAVASYERALGLARDHAEARWNACCCLLLGGDFASGLNEFEWRWRSSTRTDQQPRSFPQPVWDGSRALGGRLLVWGEQGVGDEIMFASLLPELDLGRGCILECDPRLVPLFARSLPGIEPVARANPPSLRLLDPNIEAQIACGSLMRQLRPTLASFAGRGGAYLCADAGRREQFRARYAGAGLVVGIAWHTTQTGGSAAHRRIELRELLPVFRVPGVRFVSVQYGDHRRALAELAAETGVEVLQDRELDQLTDLDGFAAQLAALDLIITIDNSAAHMAGALGIPCWTLLPFHPEWRWQLGRADCLWWPSLRLYRQPQPRRWEPVIAAVAADLTARSGHARSPSPRGRV